MKLFALMQAKLTLLNKELIVEQTLQNLTNNVDTKM